MNCRIEESLLEGILLHDYRTIGFRNPNVKEHSYMNYRIEGS